MAYLYVIGQIIGNGYLKIGFSDNVEKRLSNIQTGNPNKLKIHYKEEVPDNKVRLLEKQIHKSINHNKISGEWFNITPEDAINEIIFAKIRWENDPLLGKY